QPGMRFLDFTGGGKPYLLTAMDNHFGTRTTVTYRPSTQDRLRDATRPETRGRTPLPFPVPGVAPPGRLGAIPRRRPPTQYPYHPGYWDGVEREFRGFAMVEHFDSETLRAGDGAPSEQVSPPTLTKSWFHPGPVAAIEAGDWTELDLRGEYWPEDPSQLNRP